VVQPAHQLGFVPEGRPVALHLQKARVKKTDCDEKATTAVRWMWKSEARWAQQQAFTADQQSSAARKPSQGSFKAITMPVKNQN
jgi:hypothetical protein